MKNWSWLHTVGSSLVAASMFAAQFLPKVPVIVAAEGALAAIGTLILAATQSASTGTPPSTGGAS